MLNHVRIHNPSCGLGSVCHTLAQGGLSLLAAYLHLGSLLCAAGSFEDRDEKMNALGVEIEQELELVGVTAIEDKLQASSSLAVQGGKFTVPR